MSKGHALGCSGEHEGRFCIPRTESAPTFTRSRVAQEQCTYPMLLDVEDGELWAYCEHSDWAERLDVPATPAEVSLKSRMHVKKCPARAAKSSLD